MNKIKSNIKPLIKLRNIKINFGVGKRKNKVISNVSLDIFANQSFAIVGESGSGKSTIGKGIMGINKIQAGQIYYANQLIRGIPFRFTLIYHQLKHNLSFIKFSIFRLATIYKVLNNYLARCDQKKKTPKNIAVLKILNRLLNSNQRILKKYRFFKEIKTRIETFLNDANDIEKTLKSKLSLDYINEKISDILAIDLNSLIILQIENIKNIKQLFSKDLTFNDKIFDEIDSLIKKSFVIHEKVYQAVKKIYAIKFSKNIFKLNDLILKKYSNFNLLSNKNFHPYKRKMQMIFQDPGTSLNDCMTIASIVSEGIWNFPELYLNQNVRDEYFKYLNSQSTSSSKFDNNSIVHKKDIINFMVFSMLKKVGLLPEHLSRYIHEFSGGQKQRIGIARAMVLKPEFLIADEPISALDVSVRAQILNLLSDFQKEYGLGYIFIAHDLSIVRAVADRVGVIYKGQFVEIADVDELYSNPIHPYTKSLFSAIPLPSPKLEKTKKLFIYQPDIEHFDHLTNPPSYHQVNTNHQVFCNDREFKVWTKKAKK